MSFPVWRRLMRGEIDGLRAYAAGDVRFEGSAWQFFKVFRLLSP